MLEKYSMGVSYCDRFRFVDVACEDERTGRDLLKKYRRDISGRLGVNFDLRKTVAIRLDGTFRTSIYLNEKGII